MSASSVAFNDRLLSAISAKLGITEPGKEWLTSVIDPYHDTALNVCGYPDIEESPSLTQTVKSSYTISAPASASGGNWDVHFSSFPWIVVDAVQNVTSTNNLLIPGTSALGSGSGMGGLMMDAVPSTTTPTPTFQMTTGTPSWSSLDGQPSGANGINSTFAVGEWRQISHGFEVINTTSDLNVQGLVTAYASPFPQRSSKSTATVYRTDPGPPIVLNSGVLGVLHTGLCPTSVADAMLLPGTRQWKAKEGAYIVPRLNNQNLTVGIDNTAILVDSHADSVAPLFAVGVGITTVNVPASSPILDLVTWYNERTYLTDYNFGGAYFTGLSNSTTLTVNVIRTFERFPNTQLSADVQLVPLAKPSPKYDPQAMELYSVVSAFMPTGVPQRMNGFGEWFKEAVQEASNAIAPALAAIPHPLAQLAAGALRVGKSVADSYDKKPTSTPAAPSAGSVFTPTGDSRSPVVARVRPLRRPGMVSVPTSTRIIMPSVQPQSSTQAGTRRRRRRLLAAPAA